jgi:hypothetical protein
MDESGQFCLGSISHCRDKLARFILGRHFAFVPFYYLYFYDLHACIALCMQYLPLAIWIDVITKISLRSSEGS